MATKGRMAEEIMKLVEGNDEAAASSVTLNELKIAIGQVCNSLLKTDYFQVNAKMGEMIPNGSVLGLYENIAVTTTGGRSKATLPIKPLKLPRNMGVFAVYPKYTTLGNYEYDKEFIPLQMGQAGLIKSQVLINDLMGQVAYENYGQELIFTKDIKSLFPDVVLAMRLAIMDISQYGDFDPLPILPEQEWTIKQEVYKLYATEPTLDAVVDASVKEQKGTPINQQKQ